MKAMSSAGTYWHLLLLPLRSWLLWLLLPLLSRSYLYSKLLYTLLVVSSWLLLWYTLLDSPLLLPLL
jgi:hypothetical protein